MVSISTKPSSLEQAFNIRPGEVISLVGGGGKTTLMFALAHELALTGKSIVTTTTTKIFEPSASETELILETDERKMVNRLLKKLGKHRCITLGTEKLAEGKVRGIRPDLVDTLTGLTAVSYIVIEADGAAGKPLKAPNATEPVIPCSTSLVIPVVGIDALGSRLTKHEVFRPEIVSQLTGVPLGSLISAGIIATLITHPAGIIKGSPPQARIVPLINKTDLASGLAKAREIAVKILEKRHPQIERVVLGQVRCSEPIVDVIYAV